MQTKLPGASICREVILICIPRSCQSFFFVLSLPLPFTVNIMRESLAVFVFARAQSTHFDAFNIKFPSFIAQLNCSIAVRSLQFALAICICRERERPAGFALRCATRCGWAKLVRGNCPSEASVIRWDILYVLRSVVCGYNIYLVLYFMRFSCAVHDPDVKLSLRCRCL